MNKSRPADGKRQTRILFLLYVSVAAAMGGLLWGFDAIVISGTIPQVKAQFGLTPFLEGAFVSAALLGAVIGAAAAGFLGDRFGRAPNLILAAILLFVSAIGNGLAGGIGWLILSRWIGGLGVGISAMVCPVYISEISPAHLRGRMVTLFQFAITIGILMALLSNAALFKLVSAVGDSVKGEFWKWFLVDETWRAMFAAMVLPGIVFLGLSVTLPESPRWLAKAGRAEQALAALQRIWRHGAEEEMRSIQTALAAETRTRARYRDVFKPLYRKPLAVAMLLAIFSQFSGISVVFYYGPSILEKAGFEIGGALGGFATIGFFNMLFTVVAIWMVDRLGRRSLLLWGTLGVLLCLCGIGILLGESPSGNVWLIALICGFVSFFAFSLGPIKFVFASEIFPASVRSHAVSVVVLTIWVSDTVLNQFFPLVRDALGPSATFFIFAAILLPQIWMVLKVMPETAGRSLEEIETWWRAKN